MKNNKIVKDQAHVAPDERELSTYAGPTKYTNLEEPYPGDSVESHKRLEQGNMDLAEKEIEQQTENL